MRRLVIYAHYDPEDRVRGYVLRHLDALAVLGEVRFVSNSNLSPEALAPVRARVATVQLRENRGYDFAMWAQVLLAEDCAAYDEVLLTNSSIIGPFSPLQPILDRMAAEPCDFWGLTASAQLIPHLQSYFLVFRRPVLDAPAFRQFWTSVLPYRSKDALVFASEIGLSTFLADEGFQWRAAFPREALKGNWVRNLAVRGTPSARVRRFVDPTLVYPDLLLDSGMPYVKLGVVQRNPHRLRLQGLLANIARLGFTPDWIE